jgi:hypothetical protein
LASTVNGAAVVVVASIVVGLSVVEGDVAAGANGVVDEAWSAFDDPQAAKVNVATGISAKAGLVWDANAIRVRVFMAGASANAPRSTSPVRGSWRVVICDVETKRGSTS